ncbi:MAG TPA: MlaD family protein [Pirellulaceae bacterium]|nr:MlaD family protein [Pirellulaceae bacterium]
MEERQLQFRVGLFVALAMLVLGILIFLHSEGYQRKYTVYVKTLSAPGVVVNTPVRKNGILIGRVKSVKTADDEVIVAMGIHYDEPIYAHEICSIGTDSFLGDSAIEIIPVAADERGEPLRDGEMLTRVNVKRNPLDIVDVAINLEERVSETLSAVKRAGDSIRDAGDGVRQLTDQVSSAIGQDDSDFRQMFAELRKVSERAQVALDNFNRLFDGINEIVGDPEMKRRLNETVNKLPEIFEEVRITVVETRETINSFRDVTGSANTNLKNLEPFTESLRENGPEILSQIRESLARTDDLMRKLGGLSEKFGNDELGEGTLGKLLNDPSLYDNVNATAVHLRRLSVQLEPLLNDLRIFADSIARDPSQLGVRGAMSGRPAGTGYKGNLPGRDPSSPR